MPIGHSNSENPGMKSLAEFMKARLPELEIEYIETPDPFIYV
jgi:putative NIF3 family GTP cyclohydrolase 1 type 2